MDPASILGIVGSSINVIEGLARTIDRVTILKSHWKIADLSVNLIIGQLSTIKTALVKLERLYNGCAAHDNLSSLAGDVRLTVTGCHDLLSLIDDRLSSLETDSNGLLTSKSKARLLWDKTETDLYQSFLDKQINALNLYLTVAQQDLQNSALLSSNIEASVVLKSAREITESLFALKGTPEQSIRTSLCADTFSEIASNISRQFDFDCEILNSSPYRRATSHNLRSLLFSRGVKKNTQAISPSDSVSKRGEHRPISVEMKRTAVPPALRGIFSAKHAVVVRAPAEVEQSMTHFMSSTLLSQATARSLYRVSVYGLSHNLSLTLRLCISLPSACLTGDRLICSIVMRHYLIGIASCLSRLDLKGASAPTSLTVSRLMDQVREMGSFDDSTRRTFIDDVNALWKDYIFQTRIVRHAGKDLTAVLLHVVRETARMKSKDYVPSQKDIDCVRHVSACDFCNFVEKGTSSFSSTFSSLKDSSMLRYIPRHAETTHAVVAIDITFLLVYFEEQQGSLHWSSDNEIEALIDTVRGDVSTLISQSQQLKMLRAVVQMASTRLTAIFNKTRKLQKILGSKFGIVLSGAGHGSYPDLPKEFSDFVVDEFRRQSCGSFEAICTNLDQRDSSLGKQLRKQIQASGPATDGESLDPSLVGRANLRMNGLAELASSSEVLHSTDASESMGSASTAPSTVQRGDLASGPSTPTKAASIRRTDTDDTLLESQAFESIPRKVADPENRLYADLAHCGLGEAG